MNIWFDLSNSPHINMFEYLINDLQSMGHNIIITSRPLSNTIDLLNQKKIKHTVIGSHYGKNKLKKILGYPVRVYQLYNFLRNKNLDVSVSQSSFHSPIVSWLLKIPSIYTNDNEYAQGNKIAFFFSTKILIPEYITQSKMINKNLYYKVSKYPGLKEGMYLWQKNEVIKSNKFNSVKTGKNIFIRPEPQTAAYYKGKTNFLDSLILSLQHNYSVTILCRNINQFNYYNNSRFSKINLPIKPLLFDQIVMDCSLFIGAGGSMSRELCILGIPTISVYQDKLLDVDKYLINNNLLIYEPNLTFNKVKTILSTNHTTHTSNDLLLKGLQTYQLFKEEILKFNMYD